MAEFVIAHQQLESTLHDYPEVLKLWNDEVVAWEHDSSKPNPFEPEVKGTAFVNYQLPPVFYPVATRSHSYSSSASNGRR